MSLWSGRFKGKMSEAFKKLNSSLDVDIRLLPYEVRQNSAYARALYKIDILTKDEAAKIESALKQILLEYNSGAYLPLPEDEDIHSLVERRLIEIAGDAGKKIHTGRSRNEEIITEVKMYLKDAVSQMRTSIKGVIASILKLAEDNITAVMPGFTHMQHAQPILFAHYLCSFAYSLKTDDENLANIVKTYLSDCPMGSGAIAGSAFPIGREKIAKELLFERPSPNSISAISNRDEILELASALSLIMIHLSRYAEDLIVWSTKEFGFIELGEDVSTGSSMMPQKKNPDSLELIRGKTARVIGNMNALFTLMKALPLTYSRDMQEDKPPIFNSIDETGLCLEVFKDVIATLKINKDAMLSQIEHQLFATDIADYLVKKGLPFREAHEVVGKLTRDSIGQNKKFGDYSVSELKNFSPLFDEDFIHCLELEFSLKAREISGGTGPESVKDQLEDLKRGS